MVVLYTERTVGQSIEFAFKKKIHESSKRTSQIEIDKLFHHGYKVREKKCDQ
jgi:hypothetical protein